MGVTNATMLPLNLRDCFDAVMKYYEPMNKLDVTPLDAVAGQYP
jgi:hypothetical protein